MNECEEEKQNKFVSIVKYGEKEFTMYWFLCISGKWKVIKSINSQFDVASFKAVLNQMKWFDSIALCIQSSPSVSISQRIASKWIMILSTILRVQFNRILIDMFDLSMEFMYSSVARDHSLAMQQIAYKINKPIYIYIWESHA